MRRNFYELATPGPAPIATEALGHIAEFYAIEKDIRGSEIGQWLRLAHALSAGESFGRHLPKCPGV